MCAEVDEAGVYYIGIGVLISRDSLQPHLVTHVELTSSGCRHDMRGGAGGRKAKRAATGRGGRHGEQVGWTTVSQQAQES